MMTPTIAAQVSATAAAKAASGPRSPRSIVGGSRPPRNTCRAAIIALGSSLGWLNRADIHRIPSAGISGKAVMRNMPRPNCATTSAISGSMPPCSRVMAQVIVPSAKSPSRAISGAP